MERFTGTPPTDGGVDGPERPHGDPPGGEDWTRRYERDPLPPRSALDPSALFVILDALRRLVPRELEGQLNNLIREFLLTLRSLIDWYLERLDRPPPEPRVEDIPID
jgi:hypothetical protein